MSRTLRFDHPPRETVLKVVLVENVGQPETRVGRGRQRVFSRGGRIGDRRGGGGGGSGSGRHSGGGRKQRNRREERWPLPHSVPSDALGLSHPSTSHRLPILID